MSHERARLIESYGAKIVPVSRDRGGFLGSISLTEEHAKHEDRVFLPRQFANLANPATHASTTGPEIRAQLQMRGLVPHAFAAGVGTGGTIMGIGEDFRRHIPGIKIHPSNRLSRRRYRRVKKLVHIGSKGSRTNSSRRS
jgi:cysteine synthase